MTTEINYHLDNHQIDVPSLSTEVFTVIDRIEARVESAGGTGGDAVVDIYLRAMAGEPPNGSIVVVVNTYDPPFIVRRDDGRTTSLPPLPGRTDLLGRDAFHWFDQTGNAWTWNGLTSDAEQIYLAFPLKNTGGNRHA